MAQITPTWKPSGGRYPRVAHARVFPCAVITFYSPDSDITMVGLLTWKKWKGRGLEAEKQVYVQIRRPYGKDNLVSDVVDVNLLEKELGNME
jgi:hypothetical protein